MALRIAFDLDGVLADMERELIKHAEVLFGEAMTRRLLERPDLERGDEPTASDSSTDVVTDQVPQSRLNMTSRQRRRLWQQVQAVENFWEGLEETEPGVVRRLASLAAERRWEVIFLTTRPETAGHTAQVQSQRWLESKGFPLPSVFVVRHSRGRIAASLDLDIVVDDRHDNCLDVVTDSKAKAMLVWRGDRTQVPASAKRLGIGIVASLDECFAILTRIDAPPTPEEGVFDRLKKLFQLGS